MVEKVRKTGSVLDKKKSRKRHILTEEILDKIGAQLEANPQISLRHLAVEFGLSKSTVCVAKRLLKQHSYGITTSMRTNYKRISSTVSN
jgi:ribosomal protein S25